MEDARGSLATVSRDDRVPMQGVVEMRSLHFVRYKRMMLRPILIARPPCPSSRPTAAREFSNGRINPRAQHHERYFVYDKPANDRMELGGAPSRVVSWPFPKVSSGDGSPDQAEFLVAPFAPVAPAGCSALACLEQSRVFAEQLAWFMRRPAHHILFDAADCDWVHPCLADSIVFKASSNHRDSSVLALPYLVRDPGEGPSITEATVDISFQGSTDTHPIRRALESYRRSWPGKAVEFFSIGQQFMSLNPDARRLLGEMYWAQMWRSRFVLCPRGRGLNSRRFFETLAAGRIPVLISDSVKLPLEGLIDYSEFTVRVPEGFVRFLNEHIDHFRETHDLATASGSARAAYLTYFSSRRFMDFIETSLWWSGRIKDAAVQ